MSKHSQSVTKRPRTRHIVCLALTLNLFVFPTPEVAARQVAILATYTLALTGTSLALIPAIWNKRFPTGPVRPNQETLSDRLNKVARIDTVAPNKWVGYQHETVLFSAMAVDVSNETVQGVVFEWSSSDERMIKIDETGSATLLEPGLAWVICRAGRAQLRAPVLIRPGRRPPQNHSQWDRDQTSLNADGTPKTASKSTDPYSESIIGKIANRFFPVAHAQNQELCSTYHDSSDFGYDELWNDPQNLVGAPSNRPVEQTRIGTVLPEQNNFNFSIPIHSAPGRGPRLGISLNYNSRVWSRRANAITFNAVNGWPAPGFSLGFGRIFTYGSGFNTKYVLIDPDGTRRYLGTGSDITSGTYQTSDGSHITFVGSKASGGSLNFNDGTKVTLSVVNNLLLPTRIRDRNGNFLQVTYRSFEGSAFPWRQAIWYITDTLGRQVMFNYNSCGNLVSITGPAFNGGTQAYVRLDYQNISISNSFSGLTVENLPIADPYSVAVIKHVFFPATQTGYLFGYSAYGMIHNVSLRRQMTYDAGTAAITDGVQNAFVSFNYPTVPSSLTDAPAFTQRTESPGGTYSYSTTDNLIEPPSRTVTVTKPDTSQLLLTRSTDGLSVANDLLIDTRIKSSAGAVLSRTKQVYANDPGGSPQVQSVESFNDSGMPVKTDFSYDSYGNLTSQREYGFQISGQWQVRRRRRWVYKTDSAYTNIYLRSLVIEQNVYDAHENTSDTDDTMIAKTTYAIDDYSSMGGIEGYGGQPNPPGHLSSTYTTSYTTRGNVTGISQFKSLSPEQAITRLRKIDKYGSVVKEQNTCCVERTFLNEQSNYYSAPVEVMSGGAGVTLTSSTEYDFNTSLVKSETDPRNQTTDFGYDAAQRPSQTIYPTGATRTASYNDSAMTASQILNFTDGASNKTTTTNHTYDGWGRVIQTVYPNGGQVNTAYDPMGRVQSVTNPFQSGQTPGPATAYSFDALGRTTVVTLPDSQTVQTQYAGNAVTAIDQVSRRTKHTRDGLGRLMKVVEQDAAGNLTQQTTYTYDLLDNLTLVNQGGQTRAFKYDPLSRLLFERIPEQSATINDGTGGMWSCKYTYSDLNQLETKTDPRGVIITYGHDSLNRLTSVSYNISEAPGVAATPNVTYSFDTSQSSPTNGLLLSVTVGTHYSESYVYDSLKRVSSVTKTITGRSYPTSYEHNTASQLTQLTYPSTRAVNINHDSIGRLSSLVNDGDGSNYLSGLSYNWAGQVTGRMLGSNIVEAFGYSNTRLQLTSQTATQDGQTPLSFTYNYHAAAGQMGNGTTPGNADQLISVTGNINGVTENATFTYDLHRRLVTSSQQVLGTPVQRRFAYDRWGNRTGMWDAVTGGTQIQNVTLSQSGGAPTNRFISVTTNGAPANYNYDAAGNVTADGSHTYTYDAENRLVGVDGGSQYLYDHKNRRIRKWFGPTPTHYVWQGYQVLAEHNGSNGAVLTDYVYAGDRIIAKEDGSRKFFLHDRLSVRAVTTDGQGGIQGVQSHLPFGEEIGGSGELDKHRFTSYERDSETATDYAVNRQYAHIVGRFMRVDPHSGSIKNPQSLNRYAYVSNDPVNSVDPLGLFGECPPGSRVVNNPDGTTTCIPKNRSGESSGTGETGDEITTEDADDSESGFEDDGVDPFAAERLLLDEAALIAATALMARKGCWDLFNLPADTNPLDFLYGLLAGIGGSVGFGDLKGVNPDGTVAPAETNGILSSRIITLPDGREVRQSVFVAATITININAASPFVSGYNNRFGLSDAINRAITLLHELGHAADILYGENASQMVNDHRDPQKSAQNSQLIYEKCFK